jgi:hypothetical protein
MKKKTMNNPMEKKYSAPAVRVIDLLEEGSFCLSGWLEDTFDDEIELDD